MNYLKAFVLAFCLLLPWIISAQDEDITALLTRKYAENSFRDGDFEFALENYLILYEDNKQDIHLNYRIGICYTEANIDKLAAIPFLEFVVGHNNYPLRTYYYLGRAYMYNYRFTEAVEAFYDYKMIGSNEQLLNQADRLIGKCYNALELLNQPNYVSFEHMDTSINSIYDDYNPFMSADNSQLFFTSKRTYIDEYEDYIANVFNSVYKKGSWSSSTSLPVNTYDNEEIVGMTPAADRFLIYADGDYFTNDIKLAKRKGNKYQNTFSSELPSQMNTDGIEMGASLTPDGNTLIFASDRRGGRGGLDLYRCKKDESGVWSEPENMGAVINSEYDDNYPNISEDGKKLYFASKGHSGVGGYDIFETNYVEKYQTWTNPINQGFPLNTPLDNTTFSYSLDGKTAYIAANRKEGVGNLDIYKVHIGPDTIPATYILGTVMVKTSAGEVPYSEDFLMAFATIYDNYGNVYGRYEVLSEGGSFFATVYPGEYSLEVNFSGVESGFSKKITIKPGDEALFESITLQNIE